MGSGGRWGIAVGQGIARLTDCLLNLLAHVGGGIYQQLFGSEHHLRLADAGNLARRVFYFARAGGAVHALHVPAKAVGGIRRGCDGLRRGLAALPVGAAGRLRIKRLKFNRTKLGNRFAIWRWGSHGILR